MSPRILLAPGAPSPSAGLRAPGEGESLPPPDARLVAPESGFEVIEGQVFEVMGALEPHATASGELAYVLRAHARAGMKVAVDMLLRANPFSDTAPDACVFPAERDQETGGRKLEELIFEVRDAQSLADLARKARLFVTRGVPLVFCLDVAEGAVRRWSPEDDAWVALASNARIEAGCLVRSLPVAALLDAAEADASVVRAVLAKGHPLLSAVLDEARAAGHTAGVAAGEAEALRSTIERLCARDGIAVDEARRAELARADVPALRALRDRLIDGRGW